MIRLLTSIFDIISDRSIAILISSAVAVILGVILAFVYHKSDTRSTKSLLIAISVLPLIVQVVILLVNGQLGTGIAVMGAFSLVRFRSAQGSGKEIAALFAAMAVGLACGMGQLVFASVIAVIVIVVILLLGLSKFGERVIKDKQLRITIHEDLEYDTLFNDLFDKYLDRVTLERVKTTNMGSMFEIRYIVRVKDVHKEKEFIDQLRCRNGNLPISLGILPGGREEL